MSALWVGLCSLSVEVWYVSPYVWRRQWYMHRGNHLLRRLGPAYVVGNLKSTHLPCHLQLERIEHPKVNPSAPSRLWGP